MDKHLISRMRRASSPRTLFAGICCATLLVAAGWALAADPGSKEDPLATVSYVQRSAQFTRVEASRGQLIKLGPGSELVVADDTEEYLPLTGFDPLRDELIDLSQGGRTGTAKLLPFHHYVNASAHEIKFKLEREALLLLKGDWE